MSDCHCMPRCQRYQRKHDDLRQLSANSLSPPGNLFCSLLRSCRAIVLSQHAIKAQCITAPRFVALHQRTVSSRNFVFAMLTAQFLGQVYGPEQRMQSATILCTLFLLQLLLAEELARGGTFQKKSASIRPPLHTCSALQDSTLLSSAFCLFNRNRRIRRSNRFEDCIVYDNSIHCCKDQRQRTLRADERPLCSARTRSLYSSLDGPSFALLLRHSSTRELHSLARHSTSPSSSNCVPIASSRMASALRLKVM